MTTAVDHAYSQSDTCHQASTKLRKGLYLSKQLISNDLESHLPRKWFSACYFEDYAAYQRPHALV